jgi:hypothetical protein
MRTRNLLVAVAIIGVGIVPATAQAATLRVVTPTKTLFGAEATHVGSAHAYLDSTGKAHALKPRTALGQLVAATGYTGTSLTAIHTPGMGAYVSRIFGVPSPKTGYWALIVNKRPAMVGADSLILKKTDEVVWIADDDYSSKNGPFVYDLDAKTNADGTVTFTAWRIGGPKPTRAANTLLSVSGILGVTTDAKGQATVTVSAPWTASIGSTGNVIRSETLSS